MFLLDTVVLSELRKRQPDPNLLKWIERQRPSDLFISVVTIGEIERGIALQRSKAPQFAQSLAEWLDRVLALYADRILPFELRSAQRWGRLNADLGHQNADLLIAATALEQGLTVVTRNVAHFEPTGVPTLNPFQAASHRKHR